MPCHCQVHAAPRNLLRVNVQLFLHKAQLPLRLPYGVAKPPLGRSDLLMCHLRAVLPLSIFHLMRTRLI